MPGKAASVPSCGAMLGERCGDGEALAGTHFEPGTSGIRAAIAKSALCGQARERALKISEKWSNVLLRNPPHHQNTHSIAKAKMGSVERECRNNREICRTHQARILST